MQINTTKTLLTLDSKDPAQKSIGTVVEAMVKKILVAESMLVSTRATATSASNPSQVANGTFIYRQAARNVIGADYDPVTGGAVQQSSAGVATMQNNTIINGSWIFEDFDLEIINPETKGPLFADWISSIMVSITMTYEAVFIRGLYDYNVAMYDSAAADVDKTVYIPTKAWNQPLTEDEAKAEFYNLGRFMIAKIQKVSKTVVGLDKKDYEVYMDMLSHLEFTHAYTQLYSPVSAETLANGELYRDSVVGFGVGVHRFLGMKFEKQTPTQINKDVSFDFTKLLGYGLIKDDWAMPITWNSMRQIIDPATGNLKYIAKNLISLPMSLRNLSFVVLATAPTEGEITAAKGKLLVSTTSALSNLNETVTYQKAEWFDFPAGGTPPVKKSIDSLL